MQDILERAEKIKLVIFDVDGVLTDGSLFFGDDGQEYKAFYSRDGLGIKLLQKELSQLCRDIPDMKRQGPYPLKLFDQLANKYDAMVRVYSAGGRKLFYQCKEFDKRLPMLEFLVTKRGLREGEEDYHINVILNLEAYMKKIGVPCPACQKPISFIKSHNCRHVENRACLACHSTYTRNFPQRKLHVESAAIRSAFV